MVNLRGVQPQAHKHADFSRVKPTPAPIPRDALSALHVRVSPDEFEEGLRLSTANAAAQAREAASSRLRDIRSPQEEIVGPFLARSGADVELAKREVQKLAQQGPEAVRRWSTSNVRNRRGPRDDTSHSDEFLLRREAAVGAKPIGVPSKRRWKEAQKRSRTLHERQTDQQERCFVGNEVLSCYPTAGLRIPQDTWSRFIWNHNYPRFAQIGFVDVYLFRQDTDTLQTSWLSQSNEAGRLSFSPTEAFWANRQRAASIQPGQNITWPFYFVVTYAGQGLAGTTSRLATWTAVQTALPLSIQSSQSSAAAAAAAASASSVAAASVVSMSQSANAISSSAAASLSSALQSSLNADGMTGTQTLQGTATVTLPNGSTVLVTATGYANGSLPLDSPSPPTSGLPAYAIALIVIFGLLALIALIVGWYFLMAWIRRRGNRSSNDSTAPIMVGADNATRSSYIASDAGQTTRMATGAAMGSSLRSAEEEHPFTTDEATRMADAFRAALRKPEFSSAFGSPGSEDNSPNESDQHRGENLLRQELASEGKGLQAVSDRRQAELHQDSDQR